MLSRRQLLRNALALTGGGLLIRHLGGCASDDACAVSGDFTCKLVGDRRIIESDGIPDHATGIFPNDGCPIAIRSVHHHYEMPLQPVEASSLTPIGFTELGISITGIPFDPAGPWWEGDSSLGWRFEVMSALARGPLGLDFQNAHVQPSGAYHYHGVPAALGALADATRDMLLVGFAADGFPIYGPYAYERADDPHSPLVMMQSSYRLRSGLRGGGPGGSFDGSFVEDYQYAAEGDLDEANGRRGVTPEFPRGTYYYVITNTFPFIPRLFRGTPDPTFTHGGDPGIMGVPPVLRGYHA